MKVELPTTIPQSSALTPREKAVYTAISIENASTEKAREVMVKVRRELSEATAYPTADYLTSFSSPEIRLPTSLSRAYQSTMVDFALDPDMSSQATTDTLTGRRIIYNRTRAIVLYTLGFEFDETPPHGLKPQQLIISDNTRFDDEGKLSFPQAGHRFSVASWKGKEFHYTPSPTHPTVYWVRSFHDEKKAPGQIPSTVISDHLAYAPHGQALLDYLEKR